MIAAYDLGYSPPTYDVVSSLMAFEQQRIELKEETIAIDIVPGPAGGFRRDKFWPQDVAERKKLLANVVVPMCEMLPTCWRITVLADRQQATAGSYGLGVALHPFQQFVMAYSKGIRPLEAPGLLVGMSSADDRLITMTLREADHHPERNSNRLVWLDAARQLQRDGWRVVIVRDTLLADVPLLGFNCDSAAARSIRPRAALYRSAACNLFVSNGPAWFAFALDVPAAILRPATEGIGRIYGRRWLESLGVKDQLPGAPPWQRLVWEPETAEAIVTAAQVVIASRPSSSAGRAV